MDNRAPLLRYGIAVASVALALSLASLLSPRADPSHFTLFFAAVMLSSWYGGLGAGLLATVLSALSLDYFFVAPIHSLTLDWQALLRLSTFVTVALVTSSLTAARKRAEEALRTAQAELERRVQERTAELAEANTSLRAEISERQRAENELWRLQREMGRVERLAALGHMAATIAHELGTPLNSVLGYTQLLLRDGLPDAQATKLAVIESQVQRMIETIRSVLDRTRDRELKRTPVALGPLAAEAMALISPRLAGRALFLRSDVPSVLPPVPADETGL